MLFVKCSSTITQGTKTIHCIYQYNIFRPKFVNNCISGEGSNRFSLMVYIFLVSVTGSEYFASIMPRVSTWGKKIGIGILVGQVFSDGSKQWFGPRAMRGKNLAVILAIWYQVKYFFSSEWDKMIKNHMKIFVTCPWTWMDKYRTCFIVCSILVNTVLFQFKFAFHSYLCGVFTIMASFRNPTI